MEPIYVCGRNGRSQVDKELQKIDRTQTITKKRTVRYFKKEEWYQFLGKMSVNNYRNNSDPDI